MSDLLDLPGAVEVSRDTKGESCFFEARSADPVGAACKLSCKLRKNGTKVREINDVPHLGKPALIRYHVQRFACSDCVNDDGEVVGSGGVYERLPFLQEGTWMTRRLVVHIAKQSMRRTFAEVGRECSVDPKTASKAFTMYTDERIGQLKRQTPRVLGIDEKKLLGDYRATLGNIEERTVIDMLVDRKGALEQFLLDMPDRQRVEVVVTDRYEDYRRIVRQKMPGRLHVTDRFHVTDKAAVVLDKIRTTEGKRLDGHQRASLRMAKNLFRGRWAKLDDESREALDRWFERVPILRDAYWAKEHYCDMYLCTSPAEAERYYHAWHRDLPESVADKFGPACTIPKTWLPMVFAYFEEPYTTGYVESINRFLDDLQRDGRGYSFEVMRAKLLLSPPLEKKTFRPKKGMKPDDRHFSGTPPWIEEQNWGIDLDALIRQWGDPRSYLSTQPVWYLGM